MILGFATYLIYYNTSNSSTISFDGDTTSYVFEGKLISSDKESTLKILPFDRHYDRSGIHISSSDLTEASSNKRITSENIKFNGSTSFALPNMSIVSGAKTVNVSISNNDPGLYHGVLNITNENKEIIVPIIVNSKATLLKVLIWVIDGIVLSVGIWNVIGYIFLNRRQEKIKTGIQEFAGRAYRSQDPRIIANIPNIRASLHQIISKLEQSNVDSAQREFTNLQTILPVVNSEHNINRLLDWNNLDQDNYIYYNDLMNYFYDADTQKNTKFSSVKYAQQNGVVEKNIISGLISVSFGLIAGFIVLLQSDYISNMRVIGYSEASILFLIGVGIGNLNEGIGKLWDREKK